MPPAATLEPPVVAESKLQRIRVPFHVKTEDVDEDARTFSGLAAVWDLDLGDDVIHKGAFRDTLAEWRNSGQAMPLLNSHNHFDIFAALGQMLDAKETKAGLLSKWEVIDGPDGDRALDRLRPSKRTGRAVVGSMSIGYEAQKFDFEESDDARFGRIRNLRKVGLKEVSLVLFPMAPGALIDVQTVKSMLQHRATPEQVAELTRLTDELGTMLKTYQAPPTPDPGGDTLVDGPDTTMLDRLMVRRLRRLAR